MRYSEEDKQAVKKIIIDKISKIVDDALIDLEISYEYDPYREEVLLNSFRIFGKLHFVPVNEVNYGKNYYINFDNMGKKL
jgi:hypothetical protein